MINYWLIKYGKNMGKKNIFYAQSGGVTSVINATAKGVIEEAKKNNDEIASVLIGKNGILGAINEELINVNEEDNLSFLDYIPGGAFGSCRYKLMDPSKNDSEYKRIIEVFRAHNIGYFLYNGGGDSQDTTNKLYEICKKLNTDIKCVGIPKTIDNDLPYTDNSPGYGSVAKYVATSTIEVVLDIKSMCKTSTKVFVMEVMGRNSGWIAASAGIIQSNFKRKLPLVILFPEIEFNKEKFLLKVKYLVNKFGYCVVIVSEGISINNTNVLAVENVKDPFGNYQLGGSGIFIAGLVRNNLKYKVLYSVCGYLQRSARHISSLTDVVQAYTIGREAVKKVINGKSGIMLTINRINSEEYKWEIGEVDLKLVANIEKKLPRNFINSEGFGITDECIKYILPLVNGESHPIYKNGIPNYIMFDWKIVEKKLPAFFNYG